MRSKPATEDLLNMHTQKGVSLLEIIVVMVIAAVIVGMGAPKVSGALRQRSVTAAADQFLLAHSFARSTGIRYGRVAQLHIDASTARVWVDVDTSANRVGQRATISSVRRLSSNGVTMASNRAVVCFDARGVATTGGVCEAGNLAITFTDVDKSASVSSTVLGKIVR
jgi:prepilin-type N-terminal cleavage/methylation domain-containing protein